MREKMTGLTVLRLPAGAAFAMVFALAVGIPAALGTLASPAAAETREVELSLYRVSSQATHRLLDTERAAFAALAGSDRFQRVTALPPSDLAIVPGATPGANDGLTRIALRELGEEDAKAAAEASGARGEVLTNLLTTDFGGVADLDQIMHVEVGQRDAQWRCLTEALYFEARGESLLGQIAVAEVILNRVKTEGYPDTVCGVVRQGEENPKGCQFSFMCDGKAEDIRNKKKFEELGKIAWVMLQGKPRTVTGNATHYHATSVMPRWARKLEPTARIGDHIFYR
jgi:hypothetical protein